MENYSEKYFYAYKIGLIKIENYENEKLIQMPTSGTLVDDFSEYSFNRKQNVIKITEGQDVVKDMYLSVGIFERPDKNSYFQYTSNEWMDISKGFGYGAAHPFKETTHIMETISRIIVDFPNKKSIIYEIVEAVPYEYGINYTVEFNGKRKTITKSKEPSGSYCFSLEHEWIVNKIFEAMPAGID